MKILVIGHSVEDTIFTGDKIVKQPGGIFYVASALNAFAESADSFYLLTALEEENYSLFREVYKNFNLQFSHYRGSIPKIKLVIKEKGEREEHYENITGKLDTSSLPEEVFDGILVNMITGFDISLDDIQKIRKKYNCPVFMDVHSLSRKLDENNMKVFTKINDFDKWAKCIDFLQVNEFEILTISDKKEEYDIAEEMLGYGVKVLLATKGEAGVRVFTTRNEEVFSFFLPAIQVTTNNKVGCGDIFGTLFFYSYLKSKDVFSAVKTANIAAGFIASYKDQSMIANLKKNVMEFYD